MSDLRTLPLEARHEALGTRWGEFAGWRMPLWYGGAVEEHMAVRNAAGVFDISHMGRYRVDGEGAAALLASVFTRDPAKLAPGGRLFIYVPAFPVLFTSMDAKVGHVRRYTRATLHASLTNAGFAIRTLRYADSLGFPATLAFKLFDNGRGDVNRAMLRFYDRLAFPLSRALDALTHRWFGKNLLALAVKPAP